MTGTECLIYTAEDAESPHTPIVCLKKQYKPYESSHFAPEQLMKNPVPIMMPTSQRVIDALVIVKLVFQVII